MFRKLVMLVLSTVLLCLPAALGEEAGVEQTFDPALVTSIYLDVWERQVRVCPSEDGLIHLRYTEAEREAYTAVVSPQKALRITLAQDKGLWDYVGLLPEVSQRTVTLALPQAAFECISLATAGETLSVEKMPCAQQVVLCNRDGEIVFDGLQAGKSIVITQKNGHVKGTVVGGYDDFAIACTVKKGQSTLPTQKAGGDKELCVKCNHGNVSIDFVREGP